MQPDNAGPIPPAPSLLVKREDGQGDRGNRRVQTSHPGKRTVCDHCRRRRIRCDGQFPCQQCSSATLTCKRDHIPKKRGPKRGHGRVINELRAREKGPRELDSASNSDNETDQFTSATTSAAPSPPTQKFMPWTYVTSDPRHAPEPKSAFTSDAYRPISRNYLYLIPRCVELFFEHIYPIMPLVYMPTVRATFVRPMTLSEKNLIYAMSALTAFHMSAKSLATPGYPSWDEVGRFFLDECISVRQTYDFPEDTSLYAVISSFWLSTSFFEINQSRKSWYYLREALTLAIEIRLHDDAACEGLTREEILCRQRVFWILFVTERSFAILRNKPLTLRKTPSLPTTKHSYEPPDIHAGFLRLISSYVPLDDSFVAAWNDGNDPRVSAMTYLNLQQILAQPLDFLRPKKRSPSPIDAPPSNSVAPTEEGDDPPDPTDIQKADLLITQQWLRLIVWQSSFRQGLLSTATPHDSFSFSFPLSIARDTAAILQSLPSRAVEVHGMGIFEKIFEIGTWSVNVMGAYDSGPGTSVRPFGGTTDRVGGMDFVRGELSLFGPSGRSCAVLDPVEFFVKTLSASPNSKTMFADKLLLFAEQIPAGMRTNLSPVLSAMGPAVRGLWSDAGGVVGEVANERDGDGESDATIGTLDDADKTNNNNKDDDDDIGMAMNDTTISGVGLGSVSNNDLNLNVITTGSSGYSIPDGPTSAGLSHAFSDLSTDGDAYGFGSGLGNGFSGTGSVTARNAFSHPVWGQLSAQPEQHTVEQVQGTRDSEGIMGVW